MIINFNYSDIGGMDERLNSQDIAEIMFVGVT